MSLSRLISAEVPALLSHHDRRNLTTITTLVRAFSRIPSAFHPAQRFAQHISAAPVHFARMHLAGEVSTARKTITVDNARW